MNGDQTSPVVTELGRLLKAHEVGLILRMSAETVLYHVKRHQLPGPILVGQARRWRREDIEKFINGTWMPPAKPMGPIHGES